MLRKLIGVAATTLAIGFSTGAGATAIAIDGAWHEFLFGLAPAFATGCGGNCTATTNPGAEQASSSPWTFSGAATVTVLDMFIIGDRFALFDNNVLVGNTSAPGTGGVCGDDIGACLASTASQGVFALGAGAHSLTVQVLNNAAGTTGGAAVFRVANVPEPGSIALLGGALALLGMVRRRRTR